MRKITEFFKAAAIIALAAGCVLFVLLLMSSPVFEKGEGYELSLGSNSSALQISTDHPALDKLLHDVKGESVRYDGDRYGELKAQFKATLLFTEEVGGVTNYYLYSPLLGGGVVLQGEVVNLHIAVRGARTAAGSPVIFGGF